MTKNLTENQFIYLIVQGTREHITNAIRFLCIADGDINWKLGRCGCMVTPDDLEKAIDIMRNTNVELSVGLEITRNDAYPYDSDMEMAHIVMMGENIPHSISNNHMRISCNDYSNITKTMNKLHSIGLDAELMC